MLNISPRADKQERGVQNHFSLGVKNANNAASHLRVNGATKFDGPELAATVKTPSTSTTPTSPASKSWTTLPQRIPAATLTPQPTPNHDPRAASSNP